MWELDCKESWAPKNWCFELWCWWWLLRVPWTARRSNQSILKEISVLNIHWKDCCWNWNSNTLATWCEELTHMNRPWCWERLKVGEEGANRGRDGWMASLTQWTWVWVNFGSWWWTGRPGVLQSMGSQRVRHDWVTELNWYQTLRGQVCSLVNENLDASELLCLEVGMKIWISASNDWLFRQILRVNNLSLDSWLICSE